MDGAFADITLCVCGDEIRSGNLKAHRQSECPLRVVRCIFPGCDAAFPVNRRANHEETECAFARRTRKLLRKREDGDTLVQCDICNDSSLIIQKRHLQRHQLYMCEKRSVPCRFAEWGCGSTFPHSEREQHEARDCVVAERRRKIAAAAETVNEEIVCEWCEQKVKKRHLTDHQEEECPERERPCPNAANGCKEWVPVGKFDEHIQYECSVTLERNELAARAREKNTPVLCEECGSMVKVRRLDRHRREECISRVVPCKNAAHGCKVRLRWRDRHLHEDFMSLSRDRSMLQFKTGGDAYILLNRESRAGNGSDIAPPWTAEYFVWLADPQEEVLSLLRASLNQMEVVVMNHRENLRWQDVSKGCKKKLKELKNMRKQRQDASSRGTPGKPESASISAKELAEEFNEAENGIISTQKAMSLAKGWVTLNVAEANRILQMDVTDQGVKQAVRDAVASQTAEILAEKPLLEEMLQQSEIAVLSNVEEWAQHNISAGSQARTAPAADRQQQAKEQQKLLNKRNELAAAMEALSPDDGNSERLRRRYNRELEKVAAKLALMSDSTPVEILERRGRHVIASSAKNVIALVAGSKGEVAFYRTSTAKAAREVNFQVRLVRNRWHHVVFAASKKELTLFVNGELKTIKRGVFDLPFSKVGTDQPGDSFQGHLQEIRYWRECRSVQQIQQTAATILDVGWSKSLAAYWTFEEAMGDLVDDMSLSLPRAPCFNTDWVIYNTPAIRKRFGIPPTPSFRDQTSCFVNQRLKLLAQRARDRETDSVECRQHCGEIVNVRKLETHHRLECVNRMVVCAEVGCGQVHRFSDRQQHQATACERYRYREELVQRYNAKEELVECELHCGEMIKTRFITAHYHNECPNRLITCPRDDCQETIVAKTLHRHIELDCKSPSLAMERRRVVNARLRLATRERGDELLSGT